MHVPETLFVPELVHAPVDGDEPFLIELGLETFFGAIRTAHRHSLSSGSRAAGTYCFL